MIAKVKDLYTENDKKRVFRGKTRKSEIGMVTTGLKDMKIGSPSQTPQTPPKQKQKQPQGFGTPVPVAAAASAGGTQNYQTTDETYVNTALLLLLSDCHETHGRPED